ncbi:alpha-ketoacid dehydrogenase kinase [Meira miltonrushii]|uniref:Protein-serine/threonine kinase n=1 Tax=Meira miltonrushii TaxID=1280837 RepID=A0A316V913_9BASI|nr:alpha-ketoacid dehydrogenase kinase [Meira miltonrushii]PWN33980.1 alpha-ketoacid dehydrogenase kinase [Meira miltonrushii]
MDLGRHFYLNKVLEQYAARPATRMTLRQLVFFGRTLGRDREKILKSGNYVRQELAVRIAHRIRDLQALPFVVMTNKHLEEVYEKYWTAFETFRKVPNIRTMEDNEEFCATLKRLLDDHLTIIPSLTIGIVESSHHLPSDQLDGFMERMLRSRISRRVLAEQHIALSEALDDPFHFFNDSASSHESSANSGDGDHIGIIYTNLKVSSVISKVVGLLTKIFQDEVQAGIRTGDAAVIPSVVIDGALDTRFAYIPEHLEYIFFELLKNSMTAVMRQPLSARDPVTIRATIVEGPPDEDLIVRVSDCGGGLPDLLTKLSGSHARREHRRKHSQPVSDALLAAITSFSNVRRRLEIEDEEVRKASITSQHKAQVDTEVNASSSTNSSEESHSTSQRPDVESPGGEKEALKESVPRSSLTRQETGLGLPMTKIYTDFFGGSLNLRSLDGHGMDVYVRLPKLGTNKEAIEEIVL